MTLGQWLDFWYQTNKKPNLRPNTQISYGQQIYNYIIPTLGDIPLDKLTQNDLQQFYTDLKQNGRIKNVGHYGSGLSDQTVRGCHTTLRSALEMAVSKKLIARNPADGCRLPPAKPREMQVLTPDEVQRLLIQAREDGCYELLLLEIATGLRRGELLALQWDDLNFKTLSAVIGHVSSSTTLNIYAHVTDEMRRTAAMKVDQGVVKSEAQMENQPVPRKPAPSAFQPYKGKRRKPGAGCVTQINDHLWEGRYSPVWPDGRSIPEMFAPGPEKNVIGCRRR